MTVPKEIKQRALELCNRGLSADKVLKILDDEFNHSSDAPKSPRTVNRWRKEAQTREEDSGIHQLTAGEAWVLERKKEHFDYLISMANGLLDNVYECGHDPENLTARLSQRYVYLLTEIYSPLDLECFESYLQEEYPTLETETLADIIDEDPVGLVNLLELIVKRGTLKGKCRTCPDS